MTETLLLRRADVERLLTPADCAAAVEEAFRLLAEGKVTAPAILAMHTERGGFHVKAGILTADRPYFAAKLNANFPGNGKHHGLPTIQGVVVLSDAKNGLLWRRSTSPARTGHRWGFAAVADRPRRT